MCDIESRLRELFQTILESLVLEPHDKFCIFIGSEEQLESPILYHIQPWCEVDVTSLLECIQAICQSKKASDLIQISPLTSAFTEHHRVA